MKSEQTAFLDERMIDRIVPDERAPVSIISPAPGVAASLQCEKIDGIAAKHLALIGHGGDESHKSNACVLAALCSAAR